MSLYNYFSSKPKQPTNTLPDPCGTLSQGSTTGTRGPYSRFSSEKKAEITRRAAEHGVASTVQYYAGKFYLLKESSIRMCRNAYIAELEKNKKDLKDDLIVKKLPEKKRGRPYLIGEKLEMQVRAYLQTLRANCGVINTSIAISCAEGIIMNEDSNLLACNGSHIILSKHWCKHLLSRMGFIKANTKAKITVEDFEAVKAVLN